jgi:hypothetical protein
MPPMTTIVHFQMPAENVDRFFAFYRDSIKDEMLGQPGLIDGILHRAIDPEGPYQFINVARWESAEQLTAALRATDATLRGQGVEIAEVFAGLGVTFFQHNYVEQVRYAGTHVG